MSGTSEPVASQVHQAHDTSMDTRPGAIERLQQSRQKMRHQMLELNASSAQAQAAKLTSGHPSALMATLAALPLIGPAIASAASWWANHPLRAVAELFVGHNTSAIAPQQRTLTQRHPWAMMLGALGLGALLMWARPWRFALLRRAVYTGVLPQVVSSLLSRVSTDGLLDLVNSMLRRPAANTPPSAAEQPAGNDVATPNSTLH